MPNSEIRVSIVEDQPEIRDGLARLIGGSAGFKVGGVFGTMEEAVFNPTLQMLVLSVYEDDDRVFEALCAGVCGYLLKKTPSDALLAAIREVMNGGAPMSPEIARKVLLFFREAQPVRSAQYHLTPHKLRILRLLVESHNYKTAAAELNATVHAVSFHLRNIYEKLHVHSKSEAVAKALRDSLIR